MPRHPGVFEKNGKWWIRIPTGEPRKYRRESIGTYEQAVAAYEERMRPKTQGPTLHAAMWRYLDSRPKVNPSYISHARFFDQLFPDVGIHEFLQIDRLRAWQKERLKTRSRATVNHEQAFLSAVVNQAIEDYRPLRLPERQKLRGLLVARVLLRAGAFADGRCHHLQPTTSGESNSTRRAAKKPPARSRRPARLA